MLSSAVKVLQKIDKAGYKAWVVGGAVRDIILGDKIKDVDIATNCPLVILGKIWKLYDIGRSKEFGIVVVIEGGNTFEVAGLRKDGKYENGRRPETVSFDVTIEDDLGRRDITINSMAIDKDGNIIDKFSGRRDIKNKIIRTVGDPRERFGEDYLRMMRVPRFSSKLDFDIEKETEKYIQRMSINITKLTPERLKDELLKAASQSGDKFAKYIQVLDKLKLLRCILPEVLNLKYFKESPKFHPETIGKGGTVYSHTLEALKQIGADKPIEMLATLLHDIGKGVTLNYQEGLPRYLRHAEEGIKLVNNIADRLKMSNKEREALLFGVGQHMKFNDILKMKPSKIAKLVNDENWDVLLAVAQADEFSRGEVYMKRKEFEETVDKAIKIKEKYNTKEVEKRMKLVDGHHVMELLGITPGPRVGEVIRKVTDWILDNDIQDQEEIDQYIKSLV